MEGERAKEKRREVIPSRIPLSLIEWKPGKWNSGNANGNSNSNSISIDIQQQSHTKLKEPEPEQHVYSMTDLHVLAIRYFLSMKKTIQSTSNTYVIDLYVHTLVCVCACVRFCELNCMNVRAMRK